jgi:hypothetical protein
LSFGGQEVFEMPGKYEAPEAGDAPEGLKKILADVYQS